MLAGPAGGPQVDHISHQSGRDIDVVYVYVESHYQADHRPAHAYEQVSTDRIDADRTWRLLDAFLETGRVQLILINHDLQPMLYDAAVRAGVERRELRRVFQYPRHKNVRKGIIRHYAGHLEHFHVRLKCPGGHVKCRG